MLTRRRVRELLGVDPPDDWWQQQAAAWQAAGFALTLAAGRGWVTATPIGAPATALPLDLSVYVEWRSPPDVQSGAGIVRHGGQTRETDDVRGCPAEALVAATARVAVGGAESTVDLDDPDARALVLAAARLQQRITSGGGSGI